MFSDYSLIYYIINVLDGKGLCLPAPDSIYPYQKRLKFLKKGAKIFTVSQ